MADGITLRLAPPRRKHPEGQNRIQRHRVLRAHLFMADIFAGLEQEQFWNQRACLNAGASLEYRLTMAAC